jgi:pimeloyl-ACP methyl ester carboxylesterase
MRRHLLLLLMVIFAAAAASTPAAAAPPGLPLQVSARLGLDTVPSGSGSGPALAPALAPFAPATSDAGCDAAPDGECGYVDVPLDRTLRDGPTLRMQYVVFPHTDTSAPAKGTILITGPGPGYSVLNNSLLQEFRDFVFPAITDRYDLVLFDQRGVGRSQALDCPDLQEPPPDLYPAVRSCGQQLGTDSDLYGSVDVAEDVEALRKKLGIQTFDFYGGSYAAADIQAYAARYADHLHAAILDSPWSLADHDPFYTAVARATARAVDLVCRRSETCADSNPSPLGSLAWLAARLRAQPVDGEALDADGIVHRLHVDERFLVKILQLEGPAFDNDGDIPAAASALAHGDAAPLLRLAAENDGPFFGSFGPDPASFSGADNLARFCENDSALPWDTSATVGQRLAQYAAAVGRLPRWQFFPFSVSGWLSPPPLGNFPDPCLTWPAPTHARPTAFPAGTRVPGVRTLILSGDLDYIASDEDARALQQPFPNSQFVLLAGSGHGTAFSEQAACSHQIIDHFIQTLNAGDTSCATTPPTPDPATGQFPRLTAEQRVIGVRTQPGDGSTAHQRQAAVVAVSAVTDTMKQTFASESGSGPGLRGGTFSATFGDDAMDVDLADVRFAQDLPLSGHITYGDDYTTIDAAVTLAGASTGSLHIDGTWWSPGASTFTVTGTLDGKPIALSVPAT